MSRKIVVLSKYFGYAVGGSERSVFQMLLEEERRGAAIKAVVFENVRTFRAQDSRMEFPPHWEIRRERLPADWRPFPYVAYWLNRRRVADIARSEDTAAEIWSYGVLAPAALNAFRGATCYHVRDASGLGQDQNYYGGVMRLLRIIYHALWYPAFAAWRRELRACAAKSRIIANSEFVAAEVLRVFGRSAEVRKPDIGVDRLRLAYAEVPAPPEAERGVLMMGAEAVKGIDVLLGLAARLPDTRFMVADRGVAAERRAGNVVYLPWSGNPAALYRRARLVLVPSRWPEAFGRVAAEARALGIPVLASRIGGLPEAVEHDPASLIDQYRDLDAWERRTRAILTAG